MSYNRSNLGSGSRNVAFEFGRTYVIRPRGAHQATIVWLHGIGETGSSWSQFLESLPLPNIKWICPTAPTRPIALFGGHQSTAWFNVEGLSDNATDDVEGLDASATHIVNMMSNERDDIKLGVAGFSMGAAMALYSATCRAIGQYGNGNRYPINLSAAVALSGWLPCSRIVRSRVHASQEAVRRAASLPVLVCHGQEKIRPSWRLLKLDIIVGPLYLPASIQLLDVGDLTWYHSSGFETYMGSVLPTI